MIANMELVAKGGIAEARAIETFFEVEAAVARWPEVARAAGVAKGTGEARGEGLLGRGK